MSKNNRRAFFTYLVDEQGAENKNNEGKKRVVSRQMGSFRRLVRFCDRQGLLPLKKSVPGRCRRNEVS